MPAATPPLFRRISVQVTLRVLLILCCGFAAGYVLWNTPFSLVAFWLALAVILQTYSLIQYILRDRKDLSEFLVSLRQRDFTPSYTRSGTKSDVLHTAFETVNQLFLDLNAEKEQQARYLQTVVAHVEVALLSYTTEGAVSLYNAAAQRLFGRPALRQIEGLRAVDEGLYQTVLALKANDQRLVKFARHGEVQYLAVRATEFRLQETHYTLVSFADIRHELEAQEVESWQKLIRVLTHEIMNSAIPITTLADVTQGILYSPEGAPRPLAELDEEEQDDLRGGLETIGRRSQGLVSFVDAYRHLNQVPQPTLAPTSLRSLVEDAGRLMQSACAAAGVALSVQLPQADRSVLADAQLLEQVLINLLQNAQEAAKGREQATVSLYAEVLPDRVRIHVTDNGPGIDPKHHDQIFIPFFTTKASGSGIGLALSRQIMHQHKGSLTYTPREGGGAKFTIEL